MSDNDYLRLAQLTKRYGDATVCKEVSLAIGEHEFLTILGPSGSGKTTLLMMIAGFTMADSGSIVLAGSDITALPAQRRNIGVVFQNYALFPHMTIFENLAYPLRVRQTPEKLIAERVKWALNLVRLDGVERRSPRQLSGGQQQRVAIARAIIFQPKLLLMDEPLGALDRKLRDYMQVELKQLQQRLGTAVVYVTHDQGEALSMSDRIAVMNHGVVEQLATPQVLYSRPQSRFVAEFLGDAVLLDATVRTSSNGTAKLALTNGAEVEATTERALQSGEAVTMMVRPETIVLHPDGVGSVLQGRIEERTFLGDYMRYRVRVDDGITVVVKHPNHQTGGALSIGEAVSVGWTNQNANVL